MPCSTCVDGQGVGLVASLLACLSPFLVWYRQEARIYSLLSLRCGLSTLVLLNLLSLSRVWCPLTHDP